MTASDTSGAPQRTIVALAIAALAATTFGSASAADPPAVRCQRTIAKRSVRFVQTKMRALQACEDPVVNGTSSGPCPDAKASSKIARAAAKLAAATARECGGSDHTC